MSNTQNISELVGQASTLFYNKKTKLLDGVFDEKQALEIVDEIEALITLHTKKAELEGHWYTHEKQLDAYWNFAYYCRCGYKSSSREDVDGHVQWKLAQLTNPIEGVEK